MSGYRHWESKRFCTRSIRQTKVGLHHTCDISRVIAEYLPRNSSEGPNSPSASETGNLSDDTRNSKEKGKSKSRRAGSTLVHHPRFSCTLIVSSQMMPNSMSSAKECVAMRGYLWSLVLSFCSLNLHNLCPARSRENPNLLVGS